VADFDGDGFDDVFATVSSEDGKNLLYRKHGDFTFTEIAGEGGVADGNGPRTPRPTRSWFDYDNDGDPDLLVVRFGRTCSTRTKGKDDKVSSASSTSRRRRVSSAT